MGGHFEIKLEGVAAEAVERVVAACEAVVSGSVAVTERREGFWSDSTEPAAGSFEVTVYLPFGAAEDGRLARLRDAIEGVGRSVRLPPPAVRSMPPTDWSEEWKRAHARIRVGRRLLILPAWDTDPIPHGLLPVRLEAGRAFGLGAHPSTRACLELLEPLVAPGRRVHDVGSGSGVLAIAALRLGAARAVACDLKAVACEATAANAALNGLADRLDVVQGGPGTAVGPFDLVTANLSGEAILANLAALAALAAPGSGRTILGGIHNSMRKKVICALPGVGLVILEERTQEGFTALVVTAR